MTTTRRVALVALAALLAAVAVAAVAVAQEDLEVRIRGASAQDDGTTELLVGVSGPAAADTVLAPDAFAVTEQGEPVEVVDVEPLLESAVEDVPVSLVLLMDVSTSLAGEPMANAQEGARQFVSVMTDQGVPVALLAFHGEVEQLTGFTTSQATLVDAIDGMENVTGTALYDGIVQASELLEDAEGVHSIVVFADGEDNASTASFDDAVAAAEGVDADITVAILDSPTLEATTLEELAAATGGTTFSVEDAAEIAGLFEQVAAQIASQYRVRYDSEPSDVSELDIGVSVTAAGTSASDAVVVLNPWLGVDLDEEPEAVGEPQPADVSSPILWIFANPVGLWLGIAAAFAAVLALLFMFLVSPVQTAGARSLTRGLRFLDAPEEERREREERQHTRLAHAADLVEARMGEKSRADLQQRLERAAWRLRPSEFRLIQIGSGVAGAVIGGGLMQSLILGALFAVVGVLVPMLVLARATSRRARRFEVQLPDVLQLLAGSLRAGYGFLQAIDTVSQEASDPASSEFSRALNEARLGGSIDDALEAMADRLESEDFHWVVIAVTIQRQVGGNLAEVLEIVAETIRERERLRRHIKALSAEGRLSAVILILLPFAVAGYIMVVNPRYMQTLTGTTGGLIAIVIMLILMGLGTAWIRKIIKIEI